MKYLYLLSVCLFMPITVIGMDGKRKRSGSHSLLCIGTMCRAAQQSHDQTDTEQLKTKISPKVFQAELEQFRLEENLIPLRELEAIQKRGKTNPH